MVGLSNSRTKVCVNSPLCPKEGILDKYKKKLDFLFRGLQSLGEAEESSSAKYQEFVRCVLLKEQSDKCLRMIPRVLLLREELKIGV